MKVSSLLTLFAAVAVISCGHTTANGSSQDSNEASVSSSVATSENPEDAQPQPALQAQQPDKKDATPVGDQARTVGVNPEAAVLHDFKGRVDAYMKLRKEAVKGSPSLKETSDPSKIKAAQDGMSTQIRAARSTAKQGDIFTPEITAKFRRLLSPELKGDDGSDAKAIIKDDAPTNVPFKVNAKYPEGASVPTVPANLLINLPTLPEPLQYRIIEKHLLLVDEDADVILDYALNIIR